MNKVAIGIPELDRVLGGGIPQGSLVLLAGNAGAGKTIFASQFLHQGCQHGEKGIYVSFAENKTDYYRNLLELGMDMKAMEEKQLFRLMDFATMDQAGMKKAVEMVLESVIEFGAKRLVVDSVSAILQSLGREEARVFIHSILGRLVKSAGVTAIVIGELPYGNPKTEFGVEEFVADAVIMLKFHKEGAASKREIEFAKMRGVSIEQPSYEFLISKKYGGIGVVTLPIHSRTGVSPTQKLSTGIKGLDRMLKGGVYKESITLLEGSAGIGKTTLCLQFLIHNAMKGEKALFVSLEEPVGQIERMLENYGIQHEHIKDKFKIESFVPEALTPLHYYRILKDIFDVYQPTVLALDSLSAMQHALPQPDFIQFMRYLQLACKEKGITAFATSISGTITSAVSSGISALADNIIIMRYYEGKYGLSREMLVVKTRGSSHDHAVRTFEVTKRGVVVHARTS